jgi:excinuclease ABC subunit B
LKFEEAFAKFRQVIYVSATPGPWEIEQAQGEVVQQIIRPTGLLDPAIDLRPATGQVDDCLEEIRQETERGGRILVTTLTKKLSEDLAKYLNDIGVKAKYLHSDIDTLERIQIIKALRLGQFDVLVGINLLREGLDLPEVSLVVILDADKEGFLRSETALIQTCGRAARNLNGRVILYADRRTSAITHAMAIVQERRSLQQAYNEAHGIVPRSAKREGIQSLEETFGLIASPLPVVDSVHVKPLDMGDLESKIRECTLAMRKAAQELRFEDAARLRDQMRYYQSLAMLRAD